MAHVLDLAACLADLGGLDALRAAGLPREDCEGPRAYLALLRHTTHERSALEEVDAYLAVLLLGHADVGVGAQAGLAQDGEVSALPGLPVVCVRVARHAVPAHSDSM